MAKSASGHSFSSGMLPPLQDRGASFWNVIKRRYEDPGFPRGNGSDFSWNGKEPPGSAKGETSSCPRFRAAGGLSCSPHSAFLLIQWYDCFLSFPLLWRGVLGWEEILFLIIFAPHASRDGERAVFHYLELCQLNDRKEGEKKPFKSELLYEYNIQREKCEIIIAQLECSQSECIHVTKNPSSMARKPWSKPEYVTPKLAP